MEVFLVVSVVIALAVVLVVFAIGGDNLFDDMADDQW